MIKVGQVRLTESSRLLLYIGVTVCNLLQRIERFQRLAQRISFAVRWS